MCFYLKAGSRLQTAKDDILCWKTLNTNGTPLIFYLHKRYKVGELRHALNDNKKRISKLKIVKNNTSRYGIYEGIHSYKTRANSWCLTHAIPFIIPKGTKYYENDYEYVSLKIKRISKRDIKKYDETAI